MSLIRSLAYATRRVSTEFHDAARLNGDREYIVRIDITGLEREQNDLLYKRFIANDRIAEPVERIRDDELAAQKKAWLSVHVLSVGSPQSALTIATDAVRRAMHDEGIAGHVTEFSAVAREASS